MATDVTLPALGESVTEGTVTQWLKSVGDDVAVDEPLLEVSTDKVDTEIPSPSPGKLLEIKAAEDETVEVGAVLAVIGDEGESVAAASSRGDDVRTTTPAESGDADGSTADRGGAQPTRSVQETQPTESPATTPRTRAPPSRPRRSRRRRPRPTPDAVEWRRHRGDAARRSARASPKAPSPSG